VERDTIPGRATVEVVRLVETGIEDGVTGAPDPPPAGDGTAISPTRVGDVFVDVTARRNVLVFSTLLSLETDVCGSLFDSFRPGLALTDGMLNVLRGARISVLTEFRLILGTDVFVVCSVAVLVTGPFFANGACRSGILGVAILGNVACE
jgi:hypothetical protein